MFIIISNLDYIVHATTFYFTITLEINNIFLLSLLLNLWESEGKKFINRPKHNNT